MKIRDKTVIRRKKDGKNIKQHLQLRYRTPNS